MNTGQVRWTSEGMETVESERDTNKNEKKYVLAFVLVTLATLSAYFLIFNPF